MAKKPKSFSIRNAILCDDVRQEKNNKFILIGIYTGDIIVSELPATVPLAFYVELVALKLGKRPIFLRFSGPGDDFAVMAGEMNVVVMNGVATLQSSRIDFFFEREGIFTFDISEDKENWFNLTSKRVTLPTSAGEHAIALMPPA